MFGNVDPKDVIGAYSYREAKIITDGHDNHLGIEKNVVKILEKKRQCLCKKEANECTYDCELCDYFVTNDEMIKALAYAIPTFKEG